MGFAVHSLLETPKGPWVLSCHDLRVNAVQVVPFHTPKQGLLLLLSGFKSPFPSLVVLPQCQVDLLEQEFQGGKHLCMS